MTSLLENPMPILFFGILVEAVLAVCLVHTRRAAWLIPMVGVLLATAGGLVLERRVVTERERVEETLDGVVEALSDNDLPRLLGYLSFRAGHTRDRAQQAMGRIEFTSVSIYGLEITINKLTSPPTAEARFSGVANYHDRHGESPYRHYRGRFTVQLELEHDCWTITDHIERDLPR